jgi:DNA-binding CsgD family transcriptional regulator
MNNYFKTIKRLASFLSIIEITNFFHLRINRKSQFFILSNNKDIANHLINEGGDIGILLDKLARISICGKISLSIWENYIGDPFLEKMYKLGIWNGVSIALPLNDYIDIFSFASSLKNEKLNNFYLNHLQLIKRFIIFFRLNGRKAIEYASRDLYQLNKKIKLYSQSSNKGRENLINTIRQDTLPRKASIKTVFLKNINLTEKEIIYLIMLLDGKSMPNIAEEIGVSQRSVESCLETIRSKTGYNTKAELLTAFLESQAYQPSIYYDRYN